VIARIRIEPEDWPNAEGVLIDLRAAGQDAWRHVGLYALLPRDLDIEVTPGAIIRAAGFRRGEAPHGAPAGVVAMVISDYVEYAVG
jgi:hypothetical protein